MIKKARVIAFYLPQYHPIPENDEWWGKGFTEWTNVGKAKPLFKGHDQPRVPTDLGYYDLRLPIVREQQAEMAREAGVEGFCYWHYWFGNGKILLAEIFDEVLASGKPDFPFCLGWANHKWSRRTWNSSAALYNNQDLMEQLYPGDEDYIEHFNNVLPAFKDKRYLKIDGKPIFLIFEPSSIPDCNHFVSIWDQLAKNAGLKGVYFILHAHDRHAVVGETYKLKADGFTTDHFVQAETKVIGGYNIYRIKERLKEMNHRFVPLLKYKYKDIISNWFTEYDRMDNSYPMVFPNFDRSPRAGVKAQIIIESTPDLFKKHVQEALDIVSNRDIDHRVIFLKSWNEWGECNYMEPDLTWGHGYLDALREVIVED